MAGTKEFLEQQFEAYKSDRLHEDDFFHELWKSALAIPPAIRRPLFEEIFEYVKAHSDEHSTVFAYAMFTMGNLAFHEDKYELSLSLTAETEKLFTELDDIDGLALCNMNYGGVYRTLGDFNLALNYLRKANEQLSKSHKFPTFELASGYALAGLYLEAKNFDKAIAHYTKIIQLPKEANKGAYQLGLDGLGVVYEQKGEYDKAMVYFREAMDICNEINNEASKSRVLTDVGNLHFSKKDYDKALEYHTVALKIREEVSIPGGAITNLLQLAKIYTLQNRYDEATTCLNKALDKAEALKAKPKRVQVHQLLAELHEKTGNLEKALKHYKIYHTLSEEVNMEDGINRVKRAEMIFEAEQTKKENAIIRAQKQVIEEKNKDILDSITYAKRLQDAILPPLSSIKKHFPESFVLYKPKDIVAGDFYWMEAIPSQSLPSGGEGKNLQHTFSPHVGRIQEGMVFLAACDCTGHGVPGAMVSIVCSNALNRAVKEFKITEPGKILDKARELVLDTFRKSKGEIKDGMDISLASFTPLTPGEGKGVRLQWSGAFNSLWYVQYGSMKEIPGDKQPIGQTDNPSDFTTHTFTVSPYRGDKGGPATTLYLFTDGYADQFGGPNGKKFKYKPLQELLLSINNLPMEEQKDVLEKKFMEWKGELEQVDDVLIIGIRV